MVPTVVLARVGTEALSVDEHLAVVSDPSTGAVATFIGQVRDHDPDVDGTVALLEYEAHPDATPILSDIARRVIGDRPVRVAVSHRTGPLRVGELAVVVAVASAHRAAAFDVCRELIETVKTELPIWKRQVDAHGHATWKGIDAQPPANGGSTSATAG